MEQAVNLINAISAAGLMPPIIVSIGYWISIQLFQPSKAAEKELIAQRKKQGKSKTFEASFLNIFIFIHNVFLCIFSVLCFLNTFPILFTLVKTRGLADGLCGMKEAYRTTSWNYWSYLFYLSKFYEVIDTYIVIAKGRRPINLQIYHHIGAMIGCGWFHYEQAVGSFIFIVPNAFVHSVMYFYYALSVLKIKVPFKSLITSMQMIQFLFGHCSIVYITWVLYPSCSTYTELWINIYHFVYISWLYFMFNRFYSKTYKKDKKKVN